MENYSANLCEYRPAVVHHSRHFANASVQYSHNNGNLHSMVSSLLAEIQQKSWQLANQQQQIEGLHQENARIRQIGDTIFQEKWNLEQQSEVRNKLLGKLAQKLILERSQCTGLKTEVTKLQGDLAASNLQLETATKDVHANEWELFHCNSNLKKQIRKSEVLEEKYEDNILDFAVTSVELQKEIDMLKEERGKFYHFVEVMKSCAEFTSSDYGNMVGVDQLELLASLIVNKLNGSERQSISTEIRAVESPDTVTKSNNNNSIEECLPLAQVVCTRPAEDELYLELININQVVQSVPSRKRAKLTQSRRKTKGKTLNDTSKRFIVGRTDTGQVLYECPKCNRPFRVWGFLRRHLKSVHDTTPSQTTTRCKSYERTFGSQYINEEPCCHAHGHGNTCDHMD